MLPESLYGVFGNSGKFAVVKRSGLRRGVEPGMVSFIERDPAEWFPVSIDHVPPVPARDRPTPSASPNPTRTIR